MREPRRVGNPRISTRSLIVTGTPSSGPSGAPSRQRRSAARAASSAPSRSMTQNAFSFGCSASARSSNASTASTGDSALVRYSSTRSSAEAKAMSDALVMLPPRCIAADYRTNGAARQRSGPARPLGAVRDTAYANSAAFVQPCPRAFRQPEAVQNILQRSPQLGAVQPSIQVYRCVIFRITAIVYESERCLFLPREKGSFIPVEIVAFLFK